MPRVLSTARISGPEQAYFEKREVTQYNYAALYVAIRKRVTIEGAFALIDCGHHKDLGRDTLLTEADAEDMWKLRKQGLTVKKVASIYHVNERTVYKLTKPYREGADNEG